MSEAMKRLQRALGVTADGIRGPVTTAAILEAADDGRLEVRRPAPAMPAGAVLPVLPWVEEMRKVIGLHEVRDRARLSAWLRSEGKTLGDPSKLPWCGDAVDTAIALALPDEPRPAALAQNPYWARNWAVFGVEVPMRGQGRLGYGCVLVFGRDGGGGHVGFAMGEDSTHFHVLGGNQGDSVSVVRISKARLLAARWPSTTTAPRVPLPVLSAKAAGVSHNEA